MNGTREEKAFPSDLAISEDTPSGRRRALRLIRVEHAEPIARFMNLAIHYYCPMRVSPTATARLQIAVRLMKYETERWRTWRDEMRGRCRYLQRTGITGHGVEDDMAGEGCGDELLVKYGGVIGKRTWDAEWA
jgi:hypothetical protein